MLPSRYFIDLTQPEIAAQLKKNPLVILPQGSVEQHGPHLPTGTDIFASSVIAHAVAERMDGLVLPGGPIGVTPMHMPFEGTITLTPQTYQRVVIETRVSLASHGARQLMLLNWLEGNIPSLAIAPDALHRQPGLAAAPGRRLMARVIAPDAAKRLGLPGRASYEIVSGAMGSKAVTLRRVEIPVPAGDAPGRGRHRHGDFEECIYVLSGEGTTYAG